MKRQWCQCPLDDLRSIENAPRFHFSKSLKLHCIEIWNLSWFSKQHASFKFHGDFPAVYLLYPYLYLSPHLPAPLSSMIWGQILSPWLGTKNLGTWVCSALLVSCFPPIISPLNGPRKSNLFSHERTMIHYVGKKENTWPALKNAIYCTNIRVCLGRVF